MKKNLLLTAVLLSGSLAWGVPASADLISIGLQEATVNSGNITTVASGSAGIAYGVISYGSFTLNSGSAFDTAGLGGLPGILHSQTLNTSSATPGVLHVWVTAQDLTSPASLADFISTFAVNNLSGKITSVVESTFIDPGNGLFDLGTSIPLSSHMFTGLGTDGPNHFLATAGSKFSATEEYTITAAGAGNTNLTINLDANPVPEPASLGLLGVGLIGLGWRRFARRKVPEQSFDKTA